MGGCEAESDSNMQQTQTAQHNRATATGRRDSRPQAYRIRACNCGMHAPRLHAPRHMPRTRGPLPLLAVGQRRPPRHQRIGVARVQLQSLVVVGQRGGKVPGFRQRHTLPAGESGD